MAVREHYWETKPGRWPEDPPVQMLTAAGRDYLLAHQCPPPRDVVRADSAGLRMIETLDDSGRKIREFVLPPGESKASTWMRPYMSDAHLQLRICKSPQTPQQNAQFASRHVTAEQLQSGTFVLPEF